MKTAEQRARDILYRCGVKDAQSFTAGDVVELANMIVELEEAKALIRKCKVCRTRGLR